MGAADQSIVVTGVGPVTGIGVGRSAFWSALVEGRSAARIRPLRVDMARVFEVPVVSMPPDGEIAGLERHIAFLGEQDCPGYRDLAYTLLAIDLALADAGLAEGGPRDDIGVIQAFEAPGVEKTVVGLFELMSAAGSGPGPPPVYDLLAPSFYNMQAFLYVHLVGKAFGLHGFSTSVHNACSSGPFAMEIAAQRIRSGQAQVMIVAGGEAFETGVRLEWFRRLDLYAPDGAGMRPFDSSSSGFYVGEGAAAVVLESADHAQRRGANPYAEYVGGAFAQQAWKQVIPDVRAARLRTVIKDALTQSGVAAESIDLVVPHGASTPLSDGYEAACLKDALDGVPLRAAGAAFKPAVGHMLAASGIIETVAALLAMREQRVPGTVNATNGPISLPVPLLTATAARPVNTILKLSTGFTGHDAALVFRRV